MTFRAAPATVGIRLREEFMNSEVPLTFSKKRYDGSREWTFNSTKMYFVRSGGVIRIMCPDVRDTSHEAVGQGARGARNPNIWEVEFCRDACGRIGWCVLPNISQHMGS